MKNAYVPRLSADVTLAILKRWEDTVPWGMRSKIIRILVEDVLDMIEKEGEIVIAMIIARKLKGNDIIRMGDANGLNGLKEERERDV
jgi:hypothetical protein